MYKCKKFVNFCILRIIISDNLNLNILKILNKIKKIAVFLVCFTSVFQSFAQCNSFDVLVVQNDLCNSNGIVNVVYSHPYSIEVLFPNFTTATYSSIEDTITLSGLFGGDYTITTQDANACSESITLTSNALATTVFSPTFFTNGYNVNCIGDCNGQIFVNLTNPSELYTIDWYLDSVFGLPFYSSTTLNSNSSSQSNLCAGEYVFLFTAESGCQTTRNYTIREPDSLIIQGFASEVLCDNGSSGYIDIDVSGGVGDIINNSNGAVIGFADYSFSWTSANSFTSTDEDISGLVAGDYIVTVTDANGCIAQDLFTVADTVSPIILSFVSQDSVSCFGSNDGFLEVTASGGRGPLEYSIDSLSWQSNGIFENLSSGQYDIYARDTNGCVGVETFEVLSYEKININILSIDTIFCENSFADINILANGGNSPFQYTIDTSQSIGLFEELLAGDYTIFVEDDNGCIVDTVVTIIELPFLSVDVTSADLSCYNSGDGLISVTPSSGVLPYDITIGNNDTLTNDNYEISNLSAGIYSIFVTDSEGCFYDTIIQLTEPNEIILLFDVVENASCFNSDDGLINVISTGGIGGLTTSWFQNGSPIAFNSFIAGSLSPGVYSLFASDANSCSSQSIDTVITEPLLLSLSIDSISNPLCFGVSDGYISVNSIGGTLPYSYSWFGDTNLIGSSFINNMSDGVFEVVVTDSNNCTDTISNITLVNPNQISLINPVPTIDVECFGESTGQISVEVLGGIAPYNFSVSPSIGISGSSSPTTFTLSNIPSGQYEFSIVDGNSCIFSETFNVQQNTEIQALFSNIVPETCNDDNGQVTVTASGGVPAYSYDWIQSGQSAQTAILLDGGENKFVKITDSNGCEKEFSVFVPKISSVEINSVVETDNLCSGDALGKIEVIASGNSSPFTYSLSNVSDIQSSDSIVEFTGLSTGTYSLIVTDSDGCSDDFSPIFIDESNQINLSVDTLSTTLLNCNGDDNGEIFLNIDGGTPFPGSYYWLFVNDPSFSQQITSDSITGLSAGIYNLSVQDANGCVNSIIHQISEPQPISVVQITTSTSCNGSSDGEALIVVSGGTANYLLSSNNSSINFTQLSTDTFFVSGLSEGLYFYDIIDENGCDKLNNSFYISQPSNIEVLNISSTLESCLGWDAEASVNVVGGTGPYTYMWSYDFDYQQPVQLQNNTLNPTVNEATLEFLTEGFYYVHIWDFNSCYTVDSIYISKSNSPEISLLGTLDNLCHGDEEGQISLTATGGTPFYEFSLNGGVSWQYIPTFSGLEEGLYNAMVRDSLGCTDEFEDIEILAPSPISLNVDALDVSCVGYSDGSASVVSISGGTVSNSSYSYSWQNNNGVNLWPGNLSAINSSVENLLAGSYILEAEDDNGCTATYSPVIINEPLDVNVDLMVLSNYNGADISCFGLSDGVILANAGGGSGEYTFNWFVNNQTNEIQTNISNGFDTLSFVPQGDYNVVVTDSRGCTNQSSISIDHPNAVSVDFEDVINIRCEGNNDGEAVATFSGGLGFGNYSVVWTDAFNNTISLLPEVSNLSAGTYYATYTDNNGCVGTDSLTIDYSELFTLTNLNDTISVSCFGSIDGSYNFNPVGGWQPYTYNWNDPLNQESATVVGLAPGMWYTNIITDSEGCVLVDSVFVDSPIDLVEITTYSTGDNDCYGESNGYIDIEVSGGTPNYDFQWLGASFNSTNEDIINLSKGIYNVVITDAFDCEISATFEISGPENPLLINAVNTTNVSCNGLNDGTANLNNQIVGGTPPYVNVDWGGYNPNFLNAGEYNVEVTDDNGCKSASSYIIFEPDAYSVSFDILNEYCEGQNGSVKVNAFGATPFNNGYYNYVIEPISGISPNLNYQLSSINDPNIVVNFPEDNDLSDTLFLLTITDENGCIYNNEIEIHPARVFNHNEKMNICYGDSIVISATRFNNYNSYSWSINPVQEINLDESNLGLVVTNSSTIYVTVSDYASACSFTDELDLIVLNPVIETNDDFGIIRGQNATLTITNGEPPYLWSTTEITSDIIVSPLITTNYVAYALDTSTGCIGNDTVRVFVGMNEGFSPNGDGYNDKWEISYLNQYESSKIEIFNRWGASLWSASYPNIENWDGMYNGSQLPVGTYYYIITFDSSLNKEPLTGPVTIVR